MCGNTHPDKNGQNIPKTEIAMPMQNKMKNSNYAVRVYFFKKEKNGWKIKKKRRMNVVCVCCLVVGKYLTE